MKKLISLIKKSRLVFICGNGGSAATANHFAADLIKKGYPALSLSTNESVITMISNDYGFQYIFSKQIDILATQKDLLITISCSGTSANIIEAIKSAKLKNMNIFSFETFREDRNYQKLENKHLNDIHKITKAL